MKKSQRLRLATLLAQSTRTAAEDSELQKLQALAAAHPDPAQDEDDTAGAPAAGVSAEAKPGTIEGFMAKFTAAISAKAKLASDLAAANARILVLDAGNVGTVSLVGVLAALNIKAADLAGKDAAAIAAAIRAPGDATASTKDAQISTLTAARDQAAATLATLASCLGLTPADFSAPTAESIAKFGLKADAEWQKLTAAQQSEKLVQAAYERAVSDRTVAQVKELGFNPKELPTPSNDTKTDSAALVAEFNAITDSVKRADFYAKHKEAMFGPAAKSPGKN